MRRRPTLPCDNSVKFQVYSPSTPKPKVVDLNPRRILLVEDERDIAELVALHLGDLCDEVVIANDGHEGMELATTRDWALLVLDLRLPGPDGLEICRAVRRERPYQPILMLTSKSSELDRVRDLQASAMMRFQDRHYVAIAILVGGVVPFLLGLRAGHQNGNDSKAAE